jgi:hypothetical protein
MNKKIFNKILFNHVPLKAIALILGYSFWYMFAQGHTISVWLNIPFSFYAVPTDMSIDAPEAITVNLVGKRTDLYNLEQEQLAIHINAQTLTSGPQQISITTETLFLPETIKVVHYKPSNLIIDVKKISINDSTDH